MREFTVDQSAQGRRLDKWLRSSFPLLALGVMQKSLRLKRVKVNGSAAQGDLRLAAGDRVVLFIDDALLETPKKVDLFLSKFKYRLSILYEDEQILLVDKQPGLVAHPDEHEKVNTLINHVRAYLYQSGNWDSMDETQFKPALCNRIDRFTGGIVIAAKTQEAMRVLNQKIRGREIEKYYLCIAKGRMEQPEGMLENYIVKGEKRVSVSDAPVLGGQAAATRYRTLAVNADMSLLECELLTGRTHQIRAQLSHAGHPILGDTQYGDKTFNERFSRGYQALYAYKVHFAFSGEAGALAGLSGKTWQVGHVRFTEEYFPADMPNHRT